MLESLSTVELTSRRDKVLVWLLVAAVIVAQLAIAHSDTTLVPSNVSRMIPILNYLLMGSMFLCVNWRQKFGIHTMGKLFLGFSWFILSVVDVFPGYKASGLLAFLLMIAFSLCEDHVLIKAVQMYRKYLVFIAALGSLTCLDFFVLHLLPHKIVHYYSGETAFYVDYFLSYILWDQNGGMFRLCGTFNEPGIFGTTMAIMLVMDKINLRKWGNIILLIACCLTFSMACFTILAIGAALHALKNTKHLIVIAVVVIVGGAVVSQSDDKNVQHLVSRFEFDSSKGKMKGDNRTPFAFLKAEQEFKDSGNEIFGMGRGYLSGKGIGSFSSYKTVYIEYGYLGFLLTIGCFLLFSFFTVKHSKNAFIYWLCTGLSIYSRNNAYDIFSLFFMYAGILAILWCEKQSLPGNFEQSDKQGTIINEFS